MVLPRTTVSEANTTITMRSWRGDLYLRMWYTIYMHKAHKHYLAAHTIVTVFLLFLSSMFFFLYRVEAVDGAVWANAWARDVDASALSASFIGETSSQALAGKGLITVIDDVNGDSIKDILLGAQGYDTPGNNTGKIYLIFGSSSGWSMNTFLSDSSAYGASYTGEASDNYLGNAVGGIGDINGDGRNDFAMSAFFNDEAGVDYGQVYIAFGKTSGWQKDQVVSTTVDASLLGAYGTSVFARVVAKAGDVNNDNFGDFLLCDNTSDEVLSNAGWCFVVFGQSSGWQMDMPITTSTITTVRFDGGEDDAFLGQSAAGIGDVNGDGIDDFAIGATGYNAGGTDRGSVFIFFGRNSVGWSPTSTAYSAADASYVGVSNSEFIGFDIAPLGDLNGDGIDDFMFSSTDNSETGAGAGKIYIVYGKTSGWAKDVSVNSVDGGLTGEAAGDALGYSLASGDFNNDGLSDIVAGAYQNDDADPNAGQTYLVFGRRSGFTTSTGISSVAAASFFGEADSDQLGVGIGSGNLNNDGIDDFIFSANGNDENGTTSGQVYVVLSPASPTVTVGSTAVADGTGRVSVTSTIDDANDKAVSLRVHFKSGSTCLSGTSTSTLMSTVSATYNDTGGAPTVSTTLEYQLGSETGKKIITTSGANTVAFTWDSPADAPNVDGTYCGAITAYNASTYSDPTTFTVTLDNDWDHDWINDIDVSGVDASYTGAAATDNSGERGTVMIGDVNNDGYGDVAISAPLNDENGASAGKLYIVFGKASGWTMDNALSDATTDASFVGEAAGDTVGIDTKSVGDVNGDGIDDFVTGAMGNDTYVSDGGKVYVIFGKTSGWTKGAAVNVSANASFVGWVANDNYSLEMNGVGDVNTDGYDDMMLCSSTHDDPVGGNNIGQCYLILGKASDWSANQILGSTSALNINFLGSASGDFFGSRVGALGDINNDGYPDFAMGAETNDDAGTDRGQVYIFFSSSTLPWSGTSTAYSVADATIVGAANSDFLGTDVQGVGDVNGDGISDMVITSVGADCGALTDSGKAYVVFGRAAGWTKNTSIITIANASYCGETASAFVRRAGKAGDVNDDGYGDFMLTSADGQPHSAAGQGYVIFGKASGWSSNVSLSQADASFWGEAESDSASREFIGNADINGDGSPDLLLGAYLNDQAFLDAGQTYIMLSPPPTPTSTVVATVDQNRLRVSWDESGVSGATSYYVENTTSGQTSGWQTSTSWTQSSLLCGNAYSYRVKARNGNSVEGAFTTTTLSGTTSICTAGRSDVPVLNVPSVPENTQKPLVVPQSQKSGEPETPVYQHVVLAPLQNDILTTLPLEVSGTSVPGYPVRVTIGSTQYATWATTDGTFSVTVLDQLAPGAYEVIVSFLKLDGSEIFHVTRVVAYQPVLETISSVQEDAQPIPQPLQGSQDVAMVPVPSSPGTTLRTPLVFVSPTVQEVKDIVEDAVKTREEFLMLVKKRTSQFFRDQFDSVEVQGGEPITIYVKSKKNLQSVVARLYRHTDDVQNSAQQLLDTFVFERDPATFIFSNDIAVPSQLRGTFDLELTLNREGGDRTIITKQLVVAPPARVLVAGGGVVSRAQVTVYRQEDDKVFRSWDGSLFGQETPFMIDERGEYVLSVPAGYYYLTIKAQDAEPFTSGIVVLKEPGILRADVSLTPRQPGVLSRFVGWFVNWFVE